MNEDQLRALIADASEAGAQRMLARLGLDDGNAQRDLIELRQLLAAWRDAKASAWKAVVDWSVRCVLAVLLVAIAWRTGVTELLR
jgi:hypothetical protein